MKPEEFLIKYGICSDTTIGIEGDKKLTELLEEYASQALLKHDVLDQSEPFFCFDEDALGEGSRCKSECDICRNKREKEK